MSIHTFLGGIHVASSKKQAKETAIVKMPPSKKLVIPLTQHTGAPAVETVKKQQPVRRGELIGKAAGFISANVHSSVSGLVKDISFQPHPVLGAAKAVVIEPDGKDEALPGQLSRPRDITKLSAEEIKQTVFDAGIVGLGGAAFPSHVKLSLPKEKPIDTIIINGAECEPYLACDYRLMYEFSEEVVRGAALIQRALGVEKVLIGIEDDKPKAVRAIEDAAASLGLDFTVVVLKKKYPQGGEKQLINALTKREVPPEKLPLDIGVVVFNVGTACAIYRACALKAPLYERVITVSGDCIQEPRNISVRLGTRIIDVVEFCGGFVKEPRKVVVGGPLMGIVQNDLEAPVIKGTSGILFLSDKKIDHGRQKACFRCGRCVDACPVRMLPYQLSIMVENGFPEHAGDYNIFDCMECGCCSFVCPAKRDIVGMIKYAKAKLRQKTMK